MTDAGTPAPRVHIKTYGCQMNELDSAKMARLLEIQGWVSTDDPATADALLINTCTVREKPVHKAVSLLGRYRQLKQRRPDLRIVVTGCFAVQAGQALLKQHPYVDAVVGPDRAADIVDVLQRAGIERFVDIGSDPGGGFADEPVFDGPRRIRAFVAIQRGCDHGCSYCIVPSVRGRERYRHPADVLVEVEKLLAAGARDITLLGQNVNRYRGRWADGDELRFPGLLRRVAGLDRSARVRFLTSNPWDLGDELIEALGDEANVCPYLHLPVQSGSDRVLRRMRRPHTHRQYLDLVARIRDAQPQMAFSSDFLMGFPGEEDEDVLQTLELVEQVGFAHAYVFAYSPRPGTTAASWADDVSREVKLRRVKQVLDLQEGKTAEALKRWIGATARVLIEERGRDSLIGRTPDYTLVHVDGPATWIGRELKVHIDEALRHTLRGSAPR